MTAAASTIADRITLVRRYLAIAMSEDLTRADMDRVFGWSPLTWRRYELAEMRPVREKVEQIVALCGQYGLTWATEQWIDYGKGKGPPPVGEPPVTLTDEERIIPLGPRGKKVSSGVKKKKAANPRKRAG